VEKAHRPLKFNNHFLNTIIFGCITNTEFLRKIRSEFPVELFRSPVRIQIAKLLYDYVDQYKEAPKDHFYDLFEEMLNNIPESKHDLYIDYIGHIKDIKEVNTAFILDRVFEAIRHFRLEEAILECAKLIKNNKHDEAEKVILNALKRETGKTFQYFNYFTEQESILERLRGDPYLMKTMIEPMDEIIGGIRRGEVVVWLGTPKSGKSFGLISMTHAGLLQGLKGVFISLELHRYRISGRLDQTAGFLSGSHKNEQDVLVKRGRKWVKRKQQVGTIYDIDLVYKFRKTLRKYGGDLIIASAPGNTKNWRDIEMFLDELELSNGYTPDFVCVDYLRNMRGTSHNQSRKEKISENCLGLVKIATERGIAVFSAQQGNRRAMRSPVLTPDMIADDIDTVGYADIIPAICQTDVEERNNLARIYLGVVREAPKGAQIQVVRDLSRGQFHLESRLINTSWDDETQNLFDWVEQND